MGVPHAFKMDSHDDAKDLPPTNCTEGMTTEGMTTCKQQFTWSGQVIIARES